ncbi:anti-sigma factor [Paenibacillus sp. FSL H8-0537]|uniref:anti-sigma factor n=1 Tax=Paenibacillus sp. FSL H8-0537 TaxID=2921399 RepID=UPI003100D718
MEEKKLCDLTLEVLSGTCTEEEQLAFERHLSSCKACQVEMEELRMAWEAIPVDMEWLEPPIDLKQQVMDAVLAAEEQQRAEQTNKMGGTNRISWRKRRKRSYMAASAVLLLIMLTASLLGNVWLYQEKSKLPLPIDQALSLPAAEIQQMVLLETVAQQGESSGVVCVVGSGQNTQFVVYLFGAAKTIDDESYQVWLVKDGVRQSAGTMRVANDQGVAVLAVPLASEKLSFDSIGITLEPDDQGAQPRGKQIYRSV